MEQRAAAAVPEAPLVLLLPATLVLLQKASCQVVEREAGGDVGKGGGVERVGGGGGEGGQLKD